MKGIVVLANHRRGMYAVQIESSDITVFEILGSPEPELGDVLTGSLDDSCADSFYNQTRGEKLDIIVQGLGCSRQSALTILAS